MQWAVNILSQSIKLPPQSILDTALPSEKNSCKYVVKEYLPFGAGVK
jgi:hypothetical protein